MSIMKKLFALLSVVLVAVSCSNDIDTGFALADGEGAVRMGIATTSDVSDFNERYTVFGYYKKQDYYGHVKGFLEFLLAKEKN